MAAMRTRGRCPSAVFGTAQAGCPHPGRCPKESSEGFDKGAGLFIPNARGDLLHGVPRHEELDGPGQADLAAPGVDVDSQFSAKDALSGPDADAGFSTQLRQGPGVCELTRYPLRHSQSAGIGGHRQPKGRGGCVCQLQRQKIANGALRPMALSQAPEAHGLDDQFAQQRRNVEKRRAALPA